MKPLQIFIAIFLFVVQLNVAQAKGKGSSAHEKYKTNQKRQSFGGSKTF